MLMYMHVLHVHVHVHEHVHVQVGAHVGTSGASLGASSGGAGASDFKAGRRLGGARAAGDAADGWPLMPSGAGKVISLAEDGELEELEPPVRPVMLPGKQRSESPLEFDYF